MCTGFGPLGLKPTEFWRTTLAEWRTMLDGLHQRERGDMRKRAWELSHTLIAAGCKAEHVTVAKLLGEPEKRKRQSKEQGNDEAIGRKSAKAIWARVQRDREAAANRGEVK